MHILLVEFGLELIENGVPQPTVPFPCIWCCGAGVLYLVLIFFYRDPFCPFCDQGLDFRKMS